MRYVLLSAFLTILATSPAGARWPFMPAAADAVVISGWDDQPWPCLEASFLQHMHAYLAIAMPTRPIASFACRVRIEPDTPFVVSSVTSEGWIDTADFPEFDLVADGDPATGDFVIMACIGLLVVDGTTEFLFYIDPPDGQEAVIYEDPDGVEITLARYSSISVLPDAFGNSWAAFCWPSNESYTWSAVKSLYR